MNAVPLGQDYRWHWIARMWRRPVLGELFMGSSYEWSIRLLLRPATARKGSAAKTVTGPLAASIVPYLDQGTQRAILRLYRSAPSAAVRAAGADLGRITAPALVLWGEADPYIGADHGAGFAAALPDATLRTIPDAGHWVWLDRPEVVDEVCAFLTGDSGSG